MSQKEGGRQRFLSFFIFPKILFLRFSLSSGREAIKKAKKMHQRGDSYHYYSEISKIYSLESRYDESWPTEKSQFNDAWAR